MTPIPPISGTRGPWSLLRSFPTRVVPRSDRINQGRKRYAATNETKADAIRIGKSIGTTRPFPAHGRIRYMGILSTFWKLRTEEAGPIIDDKRPEIFLRALGDLSADARGEDSHGGSPKVSLGAARRRHRCVPDRDCGLCHRIHCRACRLSANLRRPNLSPTALPTGNVLEPGVELGCAVAPQIHPTAEVSSEAKIGEGSRVWHWAQVREGARIGENWIIGKDVYIDSDVLIGNDCKVENFATIYRGVAVGNRVFVGPHVCFTNDLYPRAVSPNWSRVTPRDEDGASLGANATIVCGITIGRNAMVAAGAVVTKDVPPHALVAGGPAKLIGWGCECGRPLDRNMRCTHDGKVFSGLKPKTRGLRPRRRK